MRLAMGGAGSAGVLDGDDGSRPYEGADADADADPAAESAPAIGRR